MADTTTPSTSGYQNGSNLLISIGGKAIGHSTSHTYSFSSETKDHAVKAPMSTTATAVSLYKDKMVTGLSSSIKTDGLVYVGESETTFAELLNAWSTGKPVEVKAFKRDKSSAPYITGNYIITSLECNAPANEDATYSISLENAGEVTVTTANA